MKGYFARAIGCSGTTSVDFGSYSSIDMLWPGVAWGIGDGGWRADRDRAPRRRASPTGLAWRARPIARDYVERCARVADAGTSAAAAEKAPPQVDHAIGLARSPHRANDECQRPRRGTGPLSETVALSRSAPVG